MLSALPFAALSERFDDRTWERGFDYYNAGRVGALQIIQGPQGWDVLAQVHGQARAPYDVEWHLTPKVNGCYGACSCPVGEDCKHMVAVLLALEEWADSPEAASAQRAPGAGGASRAAARAAAELSLARGWLQELDTLRQQQEGEATACLVYMLEAGPHGRGLPTLSVYKSRRLKKGGLGSPTPFRGYFSIDLGLRRPAFVSDSDEPVLRLLRGDNPFLHAEAGAALEGEGGHALLMAALATGRCYWQGIDGEPLIAGAEWATQFAWQQESDGSLRLGPDRLPPGWAVLALQPPLAVDPGAGTVHALVTPLPAKVAEALLHAPALQPGTWSEVAPRLAPLLARWQLALPDTVKPPRQLEGLAPEPLLHLAVLHYGKGGRKTLLHALPAFRYGPEVVSPAASDEPIRARQGDEPVLIPRQPEQEKEALLALFPLQPLPRIMKWYELPEGTAGAYGLPDDAAWQRFMSQHLPALRAAGWQLSLSPDWPWQPREVEETAAWTGELAESPDPGGWFGLSLAVEIDGHRVNLVPLLVQAVAALPLTDLRALAGEQAPSHLELLHGRQLLRVPIARLRPLLAVLADTFGRAPLDEAVDARGRLRLARLDAARLAAATAADWRSGRDLRELGQQLEDFGGLQAVSVPAGFHAELRPYQQTGLNWLQFLRGFGFGGVLADDMGLGKTVQALAHLWVEKGAGRLDRPALIVCPKSLLPNWRNEAARFAPGLSVLCLQGNDRAPLLKKMAAHDVVVTTYPLLSRDAEALARQEFSLLICDEAQQLKNPKTQGAQAARRLNARQKLALTGTPMENHLGELWALFDLLQPGYLGDADSFRRRIRNPVEKDGDVDVARNLARRVKPFLLRRTKEEVATELPPKTEIVRAVTLTGGQRDLYETVRATMDKKLREVIARKGLARSSIEILEALLKLRQVCCDPRLLPGEARSNAGSAKLELLFELLPALVQEGRRVLLFSQFTSMLALIEAELAARGIAYVKLTGQTRDRETPVARFQRGEVPVFLVSLKAGGVGLNLTAADTVIHYDPWWNPAVENQATDRAYRIGQDKPVFVYKLIAEGTVEERILALQARKAALAAGLYGADADLGGALSAEDLAALFQPLG